MARTIQILSRTNLPSSGYTQGGVAKTYKSIVTGRINVTSYTTGGEAFSPNDMGLEAVDVVNFYVESANATAPAGAALLSANWTRTTNLLIANVAANTEVTNTNAAVIRFVAFGDSVAAPDLT